MDEQLHITEATAFEFPEILRFAFSHLGEQDLTQRIGAIRGLLKQGIVEPGGTMQARREGVLVGAVFSQSREDGTIVIWAPGVAADEPPETYSALLEAMERYAKRKSAPLILAFADQSQNVDADSMRAFGAKYLSDLLYMIGDESTYPVGECRSDLKLVPVFERDVSERSKTMRIEELPAGVFDRFVRLVDATYENTKDFPELTGANPTEQIVLGYQEGNHFRPEYWFEIQVENRGIGTLLLMDHPEEQYVELTYMGLIPDARGKGLAREIVEFASRTARDLERRFILVSVDANNEAAFFAYKNRGFKVCDRKAIYMKRYL